jgi:hypothetical protein
MSLLSTIARIVTAGIPELIDGIRARREWRRALLRARIDAEAEATREAARQMQAERARREGEP